ncbi:hypothetical protein HYU14_02460 [Candidatus Woesearchaeota archaeon]|nr:hypothetical protein [Candidatus Woesearchaeota archaeon]
MDKNNSTLDAVLERLNRDCRDYRLNEYPFETSTVEEKREMLSRHFPPQDSGTIPVVQGSLLEYEDSGGKVRFLYVHDHKIRFRQLRKELGIPRDSDVRFFQGELYEIAGAQEGEISPFLPNLENIAFVAFSCSMLESAKKHPEQKYEFAITRESGILANPYFLFEALREVLGEKLLEVKINEKT